MGMIEKENVAKVTRAKELYVLRGNLGLVALKFCR